MKAIAICGSPRNGNTEWILKTFLDFLNCETELILLKEENIKHCSGCVVCEKTQKCVINDNMELILKKLIESDILIFGSPTYFDNVTGLMKDFIDRTIPIFNSNKLKNKKAILFVVGHIGLNEGSIEKANRNLKEFCEIHGINIINQLNFSSGETKIIDNETIKEKLKEIAEKI